MSQPPSSIQKLPEGGDELRALIQALIPDAALGSNAKLSGQDITKLAEKLSELVGPSAVQGFEQTRNERGELVNEEGLPIIDVIEPVEVGISRTTASQPPGITVEPLIPLYSLPPTAQERLREKRNQVLDSLEEEEAMAEKTEKRRESENREEILRKRMEEAAREKDKIKEARELQKKMGRALLQNMGKAKEKEEKEREAQRLLDEETDRRRSPTIKKKTVAFAESVDQVENVEATQEIWGDVTPARLGRNSRPTLMTQNLLDNLPMKSSVVERAPGGQRSLPKSPRPTQKSFDSDDESNPEAASGSETEAEADDEPVLEQDEVDFDFALHQREITLEYYRKRKTVRGEATTNHYPNSNDIPDDLLNETTKPTTSQFRASRIASANTLTPTSDRSSTSLAAKTIERAVRTGKIDSDGKLVGGEADSASEEENEVIRDVLDLLRKGEVYNLGPDGNYLHNIPSRRENQPAFVPASSSSNTGTQHADLLPPPSMLSKTSKFKASRLAAGKPHGNTVSISSLSHSEPPSPAVTPVSHAGRSSPKLASPESTSSPVGERIDPMVHSPSPEKPTSKTSSAFSMIIDSPSFPAPLGSPTVSTPSPMIISSPSFPPSTRSSSGRLQRPPTVLSSTVRESTSQSSTGVNPPIGRQEKKVSRFKAERM